jgi:hypothetical protein
MKINDIVHTNKNGLYGFGKILDKKEIPYFGKTLKIYKVEGHWGTEWINEIYLQKVMSDEAN